MKKLLLIITITCSQLAWTQTQENFVFCDINQVNACPIGTYSYSCNGRYLYEVSCKSVGKQFITKDEAKRYKEEIERDLNSCTKI